MLDFEHHDLSPARYRGLAMLKQAAFGWPLLSPLDLGPLHPSALQARANAAERALTPQQHRGSLSCGVEEVFPTPSDGMGGDFFQPPI